jgi:uncharacterized membrane protein YoaK (UPF0700 family)
MHRHEKPEHRLAISLALLAGYVDSIGFLSLGGFFVSFMSGNSTRLAVALAEGSAQGWLCGLLIAGFVLGVTGGALLARSTGPRHRAAVLALVTLLLTLAAVTGALPRLSALLMAAAMGATNNTLQRDGEVSVGVTYMTGALVKFGQHLAHALAGEPRGAWAPHLLLWLGLLAGAIIGATAYRLAGHDALWIAVAYAALVTFIINWPRDTPSRGH